MKKEFFIFLKALYTYSPTKFMFIVLLNVFLGLVSGVGILLLVPLLYLTRVTNYGDNQNQLLVQLGHLFQALPATTSLLLVLVLYFVLTVIQAYFTRKLTILNSEISQGFIRYLRIGLYQDTVSANWSCLIAKKKSDLTNAFTMETTRVGAGTIYLLKIISQVIISFFQIVMAFLMSVPVTLFVLISGTALFFYLNSSVQEAKKLGSTLHAINRELTSQITEQLNGLKEIKSYGIEQEQVKKFSQISMEMERNLTDFTRLQSKPDFYYKTGAVAIISIFFFVVVTLFKIDPTALLIIVFIFARLWPAFSSFQGNLQNIFVMLPAFKNLMALQEELKTALETQRIFMQEENRERIKIREKITLERVGFKYNQAEANHILEDISLEIPVKSMVALVGKSGAGKSTIADLLLGLLEPTKGYLKVDNQTITANDLPRWRSSIGYVAQDPFLLNDTIRENLLRFNPGAREEEILEALELAAAGDFIEKLPEGLDTVIGDRGVKLSGGERQRIVLARALLRKPELLVLDEATSSLDNENEYKIQKALENLQGRLTIVIIAHRLSTISNADNIIVIDNGRIVESGSFDTLLDKWDGYLKKMLDINKYKN